MEKTKSNKLLITTLIIIILGLSAFIVYDKLINTNKDNNQEELINIDNQNDNNQEELVNTDNQNNIDENNTPTLEKFIGKYQYGEAMKDEVENCGTDELSGTSYHYLELKQDGTYTYWSGMNCGGGYRAEGNYTISHNKIYLSNDDCKPNENGDYPNCQPRYELNYTERNGIINITDGNESTKLEKTNEFKK